MADEDEGRPGVMFSDEATALIAGFLHLPADEHGCLFVRQETWDELAEAFPRHKFDERVASEHGEDFYVPGAGL